MVVRWQPLCTCNCRLWQRLLARCESRERNLNFDDSYRTASAGGSTFRALAGEARKTRTLSSNQGIGAQNERHSFDSAAVTRLTALPDWPASPASKKQTRRALEAAKAACHPLIRRSGRARTGGSARGIDPGISNAAAAPQHNTRTPKSWPRRRAPKR